MKKTNIAIIVLIAVLAALVFATSIGPTKHDALILPEVLKVHKPFVMPPKQSDYCLSHDCK